MTYYRKYEFTAFTEADLLQGGDTNLNRGDSFVMGGGASTCISTWDNDRTLSGDSYRNENSNDSSGQYASVDGARVGGQMYAENYHVLTGSDGNTYYLIEIEVEGYNAPGVGDDFFTFYGAVPPAGVELTVADTCNVSGCWVDYRCLGAGDKAPANTPPTFTNLPADGIICVDENTTFVIDSNATDADGDTLTYEIVGGRDATFFDIDPDTGELTFKSGPDYENPQSGGNNNTYDVTVKVSDGNGGSETKALWVKVKDVDESTPGECITIEAENMHEWGFQTVRGNQASDGKLVVLNCAGGDGALWTNFNGTSGTYDLNLHVQDENDGQSTIMVKINGQVVKTIVLNNDNDGGGDNNGGFSVISVDDLTINNGDQIALVVDGNHAEYVRIDKIELCQDGQPCPDGFTLADFTGENAGTFVDDQFDGFTVTAQRDGDGAGSANDAMIFDSANPTGGDWDLGFANQGNLIIISEDGDSSDPDDNAGGGTITFDFDNPSDLHDIKLMDIEETGGTIDLLDADGNLIKTVAIPAAGNNSIQTIELKAAGVSQMKINLAGSGAVDDLCFKPGDAPLPGSLSGTYFCDDNRDGDDDGAANGDADIAGKLVTLLNADGTPATDIDGNAVAAVLTDANGDYRFDNLAAGDYKVMFEATDGKEFIAQDAGNDDTDDSDVDPATGMTAPVAVVAGAETTDVDAGVQELLGSVSGTYFCDENGNGAFDNEKGIGNRSVTLEGAGEDGIFDTSDDILLTTTTADDGTFAFENLSTGDYKVSIDGAGFVTGLDVDETGMTPIIDLSAGENLELLAASECLEVSSTDLLGIAEIFANTGNTASLNIAGYGQPNDAGRGEVFYDATDGSITGDIKITSLQLDGDTLVEYTDVNGPLLRFDLAIDSNGDIIPSGESDDLLAYDDVNGNRLFDDGDVVLLSATALASGFVESGDLDFIFEVNGGTLAANFDPMIGMTMDNNPRFVDGERVTTVSLDEDFIGRPKGFVGDLGYDCFCFADDSVM